MRSAGAIIAGFALIAVLGLVTAASLNERSQAFTLGVTRATIIEVPPRKEVCQTPIAVPANAAFDGVTFAVGTDHRPGPPIAVSVRAAGAGGRPGELLARGMLPAGYPDVAQAPEHTVWFDRVPAEQSVAVCLRNLGRRSAFIYGDGDAAARLSSASREGMPLTADLALEFERRDARSLASLGHAIVDRAALFRSRVTGSWAYYLLGLIALLAVPALLMRALRAAERGTA